MHNKKAIRKELFYNQHMADKLTRQASRARRTDHQEANNITTVAREYLFKAEALRWVLESGAPHRMPD